MADDTSTERTYVPFEELLGLRSWEQVKAYLFDAYVNNDTEKARRTSARERDELFGNRGEKQMTALVHRAFKNDKNRELRVALVPVTKWNNVTTRIVGEKATVYSEPAKRRVADVEGNRRYQDLLELLAMDEVMRSLDTMLALHEDVWVQYRVRELYSGGPRSPVLDLVSPALFDAIAPETDCTLHVGTLLHQKPSRDATDTKHHYLLITPFERISLDAALRVRGRHPWRGDIINGQLVESEGRLPRMPGFLASTIPPAGKQRLLAISPNEDIAAAHRGTWFQDTLLFKESKSVNKQTAFAGDTSAAAFGQQQDTEADFFIPEGVQPFPVDRGLDVTQFRDNSTYIAERAGMNHGLPPTVYNLSDATSGAEVYLRRLPLRELRDKRTLIMRRVERELAGVMSMVNAVDLPELEFDTAGWEIDFGEVQQPMTAAEADTTFEKRRSLNLTSTVEEKRARNPDLKNDEEAKKRIAKSIKDETWRVAENQELQRMNGSASSQPGDPTPEQNGATGAAASSSEPAPEAADAQ